MIKLMKRILAVSGKYKRRIQLAFVFSFLKSLLAKAPIMLAFLALVVVLMCFSTSYRIAVIAGVIWLAILFAAYQLTQAKK